MISARKSRQRQSGERLLQHLENLLHPITGYPEEPSWGYAFTYVAATNGPEGSCSTLAQKSLIHLTKQDKSSPNYSWEFIVYAIQAAKRSGAATIPDCLEDYREKGTRMFNWYLLRTLNKKLCGNYRATDYVKLLIASRIYQQPCGLILDEFKTRSLQYHAFCLFILAELIEISPKNLWLKSWFLKGIDFSLKQVLNDGTSLYLGRGQEQIFGYGALIYSLEYCHSRVRPLDENKLDAISKRVFNFQRPDGSFPLVLRHREPEAPNATFSVEPPGGWYGYNTLFDYQPFLAYCLLKASKLS